MTDADGSSMGDYLGSLIQHLLPHTLLTALMYRLTRVRAGAWKNRQIRWFIERYGVDMSEAADPVPESYPHFNAFFTRALRDGARPLEGGDEIVVCPADGRVSAIGAIRSGTLFQAKGRDYSLRELLGGDDARAARFQGGDFATIYLSPRDYHRVHMPAGGRAREMIYIPGRLFSVNFATARGIDRLFARNERLVCLFDSDLGPMAVILVGAMLVAGMETVWSGPVVPPHGQRAYAEGLEESDVSIARGGEMGRFNTGSTVIVLFPENSVRWADDLATGSRVRMGQRLGRAVAGARAFERGESAAEG